MVRKRSVVWGFFKTIDSESVQCLLCGDFLIRPGQGTTTNLLRHLRVKHPTEVVKRRTGLLKETASIDGHGDMETEGDQICSVEVALEDGDGDTFTIENEAGVNSAINGIVEAAQGSPAEEITHEEASDDRPVTRRWTKRSLIWRHYEHLDSLAAARCRICKKKLKCFEGGSTSNLHRHMSKRHPEIFSQLMAGGQHPPPPRTSQDLSANGDTSTPPETVRATEKQRQFSVEVTLEDGDGDSDTFTIENEAGVNSAINGILEAAQGSPAEEITHEEASDDRPVTRRWTKRSLIWRHYEHLDSLAAARCRICKKKLKCFEGGSTSNLHRHMSKRHPEIFSQLMAGGQHPPPPRTSQDLSANGDTSTPPETVRATEKQRQFSVEVTLEDGDGDSDTFTIENEAGINSAINGILEAAQGSPAEEITHEEASDDRPVTRRWTKRSLIWRHYEHLDSLAAARCRICKKKLKCFEGGSTSNLHRHMSKRHPEIFSQLMAGGQHPPLPHTSQDVNANGVTSTPPETVRATEKQRPFSAALKVSKASEGEKRVLRRERELIVALRGAQREEARALEHQRELLERLRAVNAREAAAEREQIESLRKAQLEEAEDLIRQREEVQKEKAELQKKWEELQQEREKLVLFSEGQ